MFSIILILLRVGINTVLKKVIFVSRNSAENTVGWNDWAMISINEPFSAIGEAKLIPGWFDTHRTLFHDVDPSIGCGEPHVLMDNKQAKEIVDFVHSVAPHVDGIVVHCKAGISRSAAVAKWIAFEFGIPFNNKYARYNKFVFDLMLEEAVIRNRELSKLS